ncbi:MAG: hypothetical protein J5680_02125 [Neisseriaceae bacterium]|nr:hypothetical protein [Neisseriaceae bacterium]MBR5675783.1 hypothetical protein [Neisseriaceae bacterium]
MAIITIPLGILLMAFAVLWQIYIMFSETYTLNRYKDDKRLVWVIAALMFSFSLAVYYFCPNARKKGKWGVIAGVVGLLLYVGTSMYLKRTLH